MEVLSLSRFVKTYYQWFQIDDQNFEVMRRMAHYARRDPAFEDPIPDNWCFDLGDEIAQDKFFLEKGLLIIGNVGSGKTAAFNILNAYLRYLQSPLAYRMATVWKFSDQFREEGVRTFGKLGQGHWYLDELCLTDQFGNATKEIVNYFGNRILTGEEIIRIREEVFTNYGFVTHFTTNATVPKLSEVYGERAMSRLIQMCNIMNLVGKDRRLNSRPVFRTPDLFAQPLPLASVPVQDLDTQTRTRMDEKLLRFKNGFDERLFQSYDFDTLKQLGVEVCNDAEMENVYRPHAQTMRKNQVAHPTTREWARKNKMYESGTLDEEERREITALAKKLAVLAYAHAILKLNRTSFFQNQLQ